MMSMLNPIGDWLGRKLGRSFEPALKDGFLLVEGGSKELTLSKATLGPAPSRVFGFLPSWSVRKAGLVSVSGLIAGLSKAAKAAFAVEMKQIPGKIIAAAKHSAHGFAVKRIDAATAVVDGDIERLAGDFDEAYLRSFLKSDRNAFRQKLLEGLGEKAGDIFGSTVRRHMAELILRVRQETAMRAPIESGEKRNSLTAMPSGCRFCLQRGNMSVFVIEQAPQPRTLKVMDSNGVKGELYSLSFPYVVFFVVMRGRRSDKLYAFFRQEPLRSTSDVLLCPTLSNVFDDFHICFAPSAAKETLAETAEECVANFWGGRFVKTHDMSNLAPDFDKWAEDTKKDPLYWKHRQWRSSRLTVSKMFEKISDGFDVEPEVSRKGSDGKRMMSAIDQSVENIVTEVTNETKEALFNLVPNWKVDEGQLGQMTKGFKEMTAETAEKAKSAITGAIVDALSDQAVQHVLAESVEDVIKAIDLGSQKPIEAAKQSIENVLKGNKHERSTADTLQTS